IDPSLRLRRAIHTSDALLVSRILKSHPTLIHNPDTSPLGLSNTSLHLASSLGYLPIVRVLLTLGHDSPPNSISLNEEHQTPLMLAAKEGHTEVVHELCSSWEWGGRSIGGHDTCLQILLTFAGQHSERNDGISSNSTERILENADVDGNTALHFASSNGHLLVLRTLLAAGADAERRNVWSWTPVAYSATVQAEVYFKGLVAEVERRRTVRREVELQRESKGAAGSSVRLVGAADSEA
ncbi:ankyrin repeat-containing domain protein, partial [Halenospora varia]